ncbi:MarR family winged helix-turn-helix transcriptional regulator [Gracilimonas mengyeensis]|uniref:DNA-binding transcriptional regulator, MarR family n=1 Tax=Gracilimonas mengyeensis TaxID=1302730 RepID=A0A521F613_9BACT|nr:MarR family transcriptional regulator [Gracilimonas mengyeensis]SMO91609.1 DNA-binding transcriptional regulator, MarR family [Gracilimonas mengyeensis]
MSTEELKLDHQICFPVYAASRLIIRQYQPYLDELNITYPQYLVLLVLWEEEGISINRITERLVLNTNTVTPLLKRMEKQGLIKRKKSKEDQRKVLIYLTQEGKDMEEQAVHIPRSLTEGLSSGDELNINELIDMKEKLEQLIEFLQEKESKD